MGKVIYIDFKTKKRLNLIKSEPTKKSQSNKLTKDQLKQLDQRIDEVNTIIDKYHQTRDLNIIENLDHELESIIKILQK